MTFDFSNLEVSDARAWMDLPELSPKARILLRPATEANPGYYNNMLKRSGNRTRRILRTDRISPEDAAQNRADDRDLFPRFVIVDWDGVLDKESKPVPCNADTKAEFCAKLPDWLFDRIRNFAATPERFLPPDEEPPMAAEVLAGN